MFKVNNKDTRTTPWCRSVVFIVNFEHILHLVLGFLLFTLSRQMPAGNLASSLGFFTFTTEIVNSYIINHFDDVFI